MSSSMGFIEAPNRSRSTGTRPQTQKKPAGHPLPLHPCVGQVNDVCLPSERLVMSRTEKVVSRGPAAGRSEGSVISWVRRFKTPSLPRYRVLGHDARTKGQIDKTIFADDMEHAGQICRMVGIDVKSMAPV